MLEVQKRYNQTPKGLEALVSDTGRCFRGLDTAVFRELPPDWKSGDVILASPKTATQVMVEEANQRTKVYEYARAMGMSEAKAWEHFNNDKSWREFHAFIQRQGEKEQL